MPDLVESTFMAAWRAREAADTAIKLALDTAYAHGVEEGRRETSMIEGWLTRRNPAMTIRELKTYIAAMKDGRTDPRYAITLDEIAKVIKGRRPKA